MNRVLWAVIGVLLLVGGVLGLLAGAVSSSPIDRSRPIITAEMVSAWHRHEALATIVTIVVGLLLATLGGILLLVQLRGAGPALTEEHYIELPPEGGPPVERVGKTEVASRALYHALRSDLERDKQVRRAAVRLSGGVTHPKLKLRLAVTPDADLARLAGHLDRAIARFAATSGIHPELSDVAVRIPERPAARVE
jgi:hypothetical protein